jgi:hypothetical protein
MKWNPHFSRVPHGKEINADFLLSLGMHNLREAERETLRVRKAGLVEHNVEKIVKTKVFVKKAMKKTLELLAELPFVGPRRGAEKRRKSRKSSRLMALQSKNPVKVPETFVPKNPNAAKGKPIGPYKHRVTAVAKSIENLLFHRRMGRAKGEFENYQTMLGPEHCRLNSPRVVRTFEAGEWLTVGLATITSVGIAQISDRIVQYSIGMKETYKRYGVNRREKRRNWFADNVVKKLPEDIKRLCGKKVKVSKALYIAKAIGPSRYKEENTGFFSANTWANYLSRRGGKPRLRKNLKCLRCNRNTLTPPGKLLPVRDNCSFCLGHLVLYYHNPIKVYGDSDSELPQRSRRKLDSSKGKGRALKRAQTTHDSTGSDTEYQEWRSRLHQQAKVTRGSWGPMIRKQNPYGF